MDRVKTIYLSKPRLQGNNYVYQVLHSLLIYNHVITHKKYFLSDDDDNDDDDDDTDDDSSCNDYRLQ